jgi:uncharacterized RDD family membrane protein YckC
VSVLLNQSPTIKRRLACLVYEAILLFAILFACSFILSVILNQRSGLTYRPIQQIGLIFSSFIYLVGFWIKGGQTLAMKTWKLRVIQENGKPLNMYRASLRYVFAWGWIGPGLLLAFVVDLKKADALWCVVANIIIWAATALFLPNRQFLHDYLAKTRVEQIV